MAELHERLRDIARMQGREYIDGTRLEGFGPSDPPPPVTDSVLAAIPDEDPDFEPDPEPSPLIPPAFRPPPQLAPQPVAEPVQAAPPAQPAHFEFTVLALPGGPCAAECEGHGVELADSEREAVRRIVARALVRKFSAMLPKRRRRILGRAKLHEDVEVLQNIKGETIKVPLRRRRVRRKSLLKDNAS